MIVHFKAVPGHPDKKNDSYSQIQEKIITLGRFRVESFFNRFHDSCWEVVSKTDPAINLAITLREKLMPYEEILKNKK